MKGIEETIEYMNNMQTDAIKLWIIQELTCNDSCAWWLIDAGISIIKERDDR